MSTKRKILPVTLATIFGLSIMLSALPVYAQTSTPTPTKVVFFDGLVKFIADKFKLDPDQVKSAVSEYQAQHQTEMQKKHETQEKARLDQLVKDGKITQEQENAIKSLRDKYKMGKNKDLTPNERKAQFDAMQKEIQSFAKEHNIDTTYLMPEFKMKMRMGMKRGMMDGSTPTSTVTPTPTQ